MVCRAPAKGLSQLVAWDGIEPPTRGFSARPVYHPSPTALNASSGATWLGSPGPANRRWIPFGPVGSGKVTGKVRGAARLGSRFGAGTASRPRSADRTRPRLA